MHIISFHAIDKQALFISLDKELLKVQAKLHMYTGTGNDYHTNDLSFSECFAK